MRNTFIHNHERKMTNDKLMCYKVQIKGLEELNNTGCNLYHMLKGKAELCEEFLGK